MYIYECVRINVRAFVNVHICTYEHVYVYLQNMLDYRNTYKCKCRNAHVCVRLRSTNMHMQIYM